MPLKVLNERIKNYNPNADFELIERAYDFAAKAHEGQKRHSGEPYITHPLAVARILANLELDQETIIAGLLHDTVEDTEVTLEDIQNNFGAEIARMVDGVTKLSRIEYKSKEEQQVENLRKMFLAMAQDIRVILIKLADRLHNMRTLHHRSPAKQRETAEETLEIYAPLAHRLGIFKLKWEMEDLSLRYLERDKYYELVDKIATKRHEREKYIHLLIDNLREKLGEVGIKADIQGRPKNFYSIYKKMTSQNKDLSEVYDLIAVRVLVNSIKDCYGALGIIHSLWKPIPGRFKDYIAMPKSNMYQSLHTSVIGPLGEPFEIQIRTWEMHRTSEFGIAAHWRYKEGNKGDKDFDQKMGWLRQLLEWQNDLKDAKEFMETLKIDLFSDSVFVFTPKGDVIELPAGSVPIDFAFRIHSDVGNKCVGAKINGKIVPLDYKLRNGDIIEVLTHRQSQGPSRDWLKLVKTSNAKNRIRAWFKREKRDENIIKGRESLEKETRKLGFDTADFLKADKMLEIARKLNIFGMEDIYAAIGDGAISPQLIIARLKDEYRDKKAPPEVLTFPVTDNKKTGKPSKDSHGIKVKGMEGMLVRLAHCCNPVPGDPIIGYITRGRGVSVHRLDCRNVLNNNLGEEERIIDVSWDNASQGPFMVKIEAQAMDRAGLLNDVMGILFDLKISANQVSARSGKDKVATVSLVIEVKSLEQLEYIMNRIRRVRDIYEVHRVTPGKGERL